MGVARAHHMERSQVSVGDVVGSWRLDGALGSGGMSDVFVATGAGGRRAAVKILHPAASADPMLTRRFRQEARAAASIEHSGVVEILDHGEDRGVVYLAMELLEGDALDELVARQLGGVLPPTLVTLIARNVLEVLVAAHARNILHRDIKPANIFFTRDRQVKVLDFGIARVGERTGAPDATRAGSYVGTPAYSPPEQARAAWDEVDARTDVWALGATMFFLLTGRPVHLGTTANEVLVSAMTKTAPAVSSLNPAVGPELAAIVDRALARDPGQRFSDGARDVECSDRGAARGRRLCRRGANLDDGGARAGAARHGARCPLPPRRTVGWSGYQRARDATEGGRASLVVGLGVGFHRCGCLPGNRYGVGHDPRLYGYRGGALGK